MDAATFKGIRGAQATRMQAETHALKMMPAIAQARAEGLKGLAEIAAYLDAAGIPTVRGGRWQTESVRRVLRRLVRLGHDEFAPRTRTHAARQRKLRNRFAPQLTLAEAQALEAEFTAFRARGGRL